MGALRSRVLAVCCLLSGWPGASLAGVNAGGALALTQDDVYRGVSQTCDQPAAQVGLHHKPGGGRKRLTELDPGLLEALEGLVEPLTRGDPTRPLRWTLKSTTQLAAELTRQGRRIGPWSVGALLKIEGYSLQGNRKTKEGASHPDRNAQFEYISEQVMRFQDRGEPVISVDTARKRN